LRKMYESEGKLLQKKIRSAGILLNFNCMTYLEFKLHLKFINDKCCFFIIANFRIGLRSKYVNANLKFRTNKKVAIRGRLFIGNFSLLCCLTLSDPTSDLVRQYDFPVLFRCRKSSDTVFVALVRPLSEPVRRFSSCSTDFSQHIAQVVLFLYLHVFFLLKL
jgi:hypothetical protein